MIWGLAVLFFHFPAVSPTLTTRADSVATARIMTAGKAEAQSQVPAAAREAWFESELREAKPWMNRASFRTRHDRGKLFESAEGNPAPVLPSGTAPPAESTALSNAADAAKNPSSDSAGAAPLPTAKAPPFLTAGRGRTPKVWYALVAAGHGGATFDAWSTRRVLQRRKGHELNPLLQPFANSSALYGAVQAGPAMLDYLARRMMNSRKRWVRRLWWLPQVAGTASSFWSGAHNLRIANR